MYLPCKWQGEAGFIGLVINCEQFDIELHFLVQIIEYIPIGIKFKFFWVIVLTIQKLVINVNII